MIGSNGCQTVPLLLPHSLTLRLVGGRGQMNTVANTRSLAQHRKVSGSFRDGCLHAIFKISLDTLQRLQQGLVCEMGSPNRLPSSLLRHRRPSSPLLPLTRV